jgi:small subunit ribosomal protein S18
MARGNERTTTRRSPKDAGRRTGKPKPCALCKDKIDWVDYKDVGMLRKYMSDRGKIRARRVTGNCTQHQRDIALAIKTARELVLLPYTQRTTTERSGGRGGRGGRGDRPDRPDRPERPDRPGSGRPPSAEGALGEGTAALDAEPGEGLEELDLAGIETGDLEDSSGIEEIDASVEVTGPDASEAEAPETSARDAVAGNGAAAGDVTGNGA